jgi:hypothetical protein
MRAVGVDNLLLSGFVHRKQPHQVLEQLLLLGCFRGLNLLN